TLFGIRENGKWAKMITAQQYNAETATFKDSMVPADLAYQFAFAKKTIDPKFQSILNPFFFKKASLEPPSKWLPYRLFGFNGYTDTKGNVMLRLELPTTDQVVMTAFGTEGVTMVEHYKDNFITAGAKIYLIDAEGTILVPEEMELSYMRKYPLVEVMLRKHGTATDYTQYDALKAMYNLKTKQSFKVLDIDGEKGGNMTAVNSNLFLKAGLKKYTLVDANGKAVAQPMEMISYVPAMNGFIVQEKAEGKAGIKDITVTGTCFEYGMKEGALSASMDADPQNPYAIAKDSLRKFLQQLQSGSDFRLKWLRLFYMYGKGQSEKSILSQLDLALESEAKSFNMSGGEQLRDYLPVETVAEKIVSYALDAEADGIFNVSSGQPITVKELVENHLAKSGRSIALNLGYYPYPDYEPMAFWGII
ncbi:MAG: NAD-dependent epimerase/dehydratase family protein, partial [Pedobacter sp.]